MNPIEQSWTACDAGVARSVAPAALGEKVGLDQAEEAETETDDSPEVEDGTGPLSEDEDAVVESVDNRKGSPRIMESA
jgi:hypothetical protein